jgi:hypothetical protein
LDDSDPAKEDNRSFSDLFDAAFVLAEVVSDVQQLAVFLLAFFGCPSSQIALISEAIASKPNISCYFVHMTICC